MLGTIEFLTNNLSIFPIFGASAAFCWGMFQYFQRRSRENDEAQFKRFHDVIRKIQHDVDEGKHTAPYIEIQIAAIYELRFLTRYHPVSVLYLEHKKIEWEKFDNKYKILGVPTINDTLHYIKKGTWRSRIQKKFTSFCEDNSIT